MFYALLHCLYSATTKKETCLASLDNPPTVGNIVKERADDFSLKKTIGYNMRKSDASNNKEDPYNHPHVPTT